MGVQLTELAQKFDLELQGQADAEINSVASLLDAGPGNISYCTGRRHKGELEATAATAVILDSELSSSYSGNALISKNPHLAFTKVARFLHPEKRKSAGIHVLAAIHVQAVIHSSASIAEHVCIEKSASIAENCEIGAGSYIGVGVSIGQGTVLKNNVTLRHNTVIGRDCVLHSGCVIGSDGFGHARDGEHWLAVPQLGKVVIGNDVSIGANTTIDRGALGDTSIGNGVKLDNLIHIAHNVSIGDDSALAACVAVAGSTRIGKRCTFGGQAGVADNIEICDDAHFTGQAAVRSSITQPGVYSSGVLLEDVRSWSKNAMRFKQLNTLFKQVKDLTKNLHK